MSPLLVARTTDAAPADFVCRHGTVIARFDEQTQDSGNRTWLLRNAAELARSCDHPALATLLNVVETPDGPLLVYRSAPGELLGTTRARRADFASATS